MNPSPNADPACLFCRIAAKELPTKLLLDDPEVVAFADIRPQAPVHVLVIPRRHVSGIAHLDDAALGGKLLAAAARLAETLGLAEGFRIVTNQGEDGGQTVFHLHFHLLGGRRLGWPPG